MDFIGLPSIFKVRFVIVISALPAYLKDTEVPIICYKYKFNKPIRPTIFNLNKPDSDLIY